MLQAVQVVPPLAASESVAEPAGHAAQAVVESFEYSPGEQDLQLVPADDTAVSFFPAVTIDPALQAAHSTMALPFA